MLDAASRMPHSAVTAKSGTLWPHGWGNLELVKVHGIACRTAFQLLWQEASRRILDE